MSLFGPDVEKALPDAVEDLESKEELLVEKINDLRRKILDVKKELASYSDQRQSFAGSYAACYFCDEQVPIGALVCIHCRRPVVSEIKRFAEIEIFVRTKVRATAKGE